MNVVITGSTRGIGLGLAREFLRRGHNVTLSGRQADAVRDTVDALRRDHPDARVAGLHGDAADIATARALWDLARRE